MSTNEHSLAQWLDAPGTDPEGLDPEVLEAVYAMRPDLAPAPRVTADDILAGVMEGPLAAPVATVPSSLPAQGEEEHTSAPLPANRSLASWGGWGGIGLALAAAATFALVGLPTLQSSMERASSPAAEMEQAPAAAAPSPTETATVADEAPALERKAAPPPAAKRSAPAAKPRPASVPAAAPLPTPPPAAQDAFDMAADAPLRTRDLIPELAEAEEQDDDAVAYVDDLEGAPAAEPSAGAPGDAVEEEEARRLDNLRSHATGTIGPAPSWQAGLAANDVQRLEKLFADASALAPRAAGDQVSTAIQAPAAVAHHAADLAVDYYLAAGDGSAAANAAMRGLQFRTNDAGWANLAVRYADLIRSSDPTEAARWYEDAAAAVR